MAALRWGLGALSLGRALRPGARRGVTADEGARGCLWRRGRSSARPLEQEPRKDWGHVELLEVLEARVRQLQEYTAGPLAKDKSGRQKQRDEDTVPRQEGQKGPREPARLLLEPRLHDQALSRGLLSWASQVPQGPWEEQLSRLLQATPQRLQAPAGHSPAEAPAASPQMEAKQQRLIAFLQCCQLTGHQALAHHVLALHHGRKYHSQTLLLPAYNTVLRGWARKGSYRELVFVFYMIRDSGLSPDLESYAAALQCMGRRGKDVGTVRRCLAQMEKDGLQLQELFSRADLDLEDEEREAILGAIRRVQPDFQPQAPPSATPSRCSIPLLAEIYGEDQPACYPRLHLSHKELLKMFQKQLQVEMATLVQVPSVDKAPENTPQLLQARKVLKNLRVQWEEALLQGLRRAKLAQRSLACQGKASVYPHLCLLSERDMVRLQLQVLHTLSPHGDPVLAVAQELAMRVFTRQAVQRKQLSHQVQELEQRYAHYVHLLATDGKVTQPLLPRQHWESLGPWEWQHEQLWPLPVVVMLGRVLAEVLVEAIRMPNRLASPQASSRSVPVLYHAYTFRGIRQIGILKPHPTFVELMDRAAEHMLTFESHEVPMLCPPLPWLSPFAGAYLLTPTKLMRSVEGTMQHQRQLTACAPGALHGALDTLNQLGNCAWRVNGAVLDLVLQLFRDQGCPQLDVPPPVAKVSHPVWPPLPAGTPPASKAEVRRELLRGLKRAREMHSLRAEALYRLSLAQHLRGQTFWLPHNMDFRGRTYPCPPHFNHLGSDMARALLQFAQGRPLGPHGLDWLKIHLVNLTGLKKREPLRARLAFANSILEDVLDSADRPLTGRKWWMDSEEPWQTLACCMEIARAVRAPDPTAYVSHFPVHQDGSCNGLQHYAALGRDAVGGAAVNLVPSEQPQDVYSEVAVKVEALRQKDAEKGLPVALRLAGFISRKVVKQTVMTVVYGVTRYGGRLQIEKRLRELEDFPQAFLWEASHYLVRLVFTSLQEMFSGSRAIQVPGGLQILMVINSSDSNQRPNNLKQKNGFPPNFIHSLDSSHMMLTALHCYRKGLNFVSVHDCFWTHAADVGVMNEVCREQFVRLHSQPILQDLSAFLLRRFCSQPRSHQLQKLQQILQAVPGTGSLDLEQVKHSTYFFS